MQGVTDEAHEHMASAITERMMGRVAQYYTPVVAKALPGAAGRGCGEPAYAGPAHALRRPAYPGMGDPLSGSRMCRPPVSWRWRPRSRPDLVVVSCMLEEQLAELKLLLHQLETARQDMEGLHYRIAAGGYILNTNPRNPARTSHRLQRAHSARFPRDGEPSLSPIGHIEKIIWLTPCQIWLTLL